MSEPLATLLRPRTLTDFIGQPHLVGADGPVRKLLDSGKVVSMIFWGPPASGKTTLAEIIAGSVQADFVRLSAVIDGKAMLKGVIEQAAQNKLLNRQTILFIDEIHRWNKAQQDALLPYVESGSITLIGATTENPSFTVISPLISRSRVLVFHQHTAEEIVIGLERAAKHLKTKVKPEVLVQLAKMSNGDMRFALNTLEIAHQLAGKKQISEKDLTAAAQRSLRYDRNGEEHYNIISAVHKSMRSSDPTAAVYWVMRMLQAGEDPLYIARRMIRFASEDIGNANPNALLLANVVYETCAKIGMPECDVALAQLAEYLANSKKSNAAYVAANLAKQDIQQYGNLEVPLHIRNAPTSLMKELGYGKGYEYDPDLPTGKSQQQTMPDKLKNRNYFSE